MDEEALDSYLARNPELAPESRVSAGDDVPVPEESEQELPPVVLLLADGTPLPTPITNGGI